MNFMSNDRRDWNGSITPFLDMLPIRKKFTYEKKLNFFCALCAPALRSASLRTFPAPLVLPHPRLFLNRCSVHSLLKPPHVWCCVDIRQRVHASNLIDPGGSSTKLKKGKHVSISLLLLRLSRIRGRGIRRNGPFKQRTSHSVLWRSLVSTGCITIYTAARASLFGILRTSFAFRALTTFPSLPSSRSQAHYLLDFRTLGKSNRHRVLETTTQTMTPA